MRIYTVAGSIEIEEGQVPSVQDYLDCQPTVPKGVKAKDAVVTGFTHYEDAVKVATDDAGNFLYPVLCYEVPGRLKKANYELSTGEVLEGKELPLSKATLLSASLEHVDERFEEVDLQEDLEEESSSENEVSAERKSSDKKSSSSSSEEPVQAPVPAKSRFSNPFTLNNLKWAGNGLLSTSMWAGNGLLSHGKRAASGLLAGGKYALGKLRPVARPSIVAGVTTVGGKLVADRLEQTPALIGQLGNALLNNNSTLARVAGTIDSAVDSVPYVREVKTALYVGTGVLLAGEAAHQGYNLYQRHKAASQKPAEETETKRAKRKAR